MGTKRTQDSGKKDSLGRSVKISQQTPEAASSARNTAPPLSDFTSAEPSPENARQKTKALIKASVSLDSRGYDVVKHQAMGLLYAMRRGDSDAYHEDMDRLSKELLREAENTQWKAQWESDQFSRIMDEYDGIDSDDGSPIPELPENVRDVMDAADMLDDGGLNVMEKYASRFLLDVAHDSNFTDRSVIQCVEDLKFESEGRQWFRKEDQEKFDAKVKKILDNAKW